MYLTSHCTDVPTSPQIPLEPHSSSEHRWALSCSLVASRRPQILHSLLVGLNQTVTAGQAEVCHEHDHLYRFAYPRSISVRKPRIKLTFRSFRCLSLDAEMLVWQTSVDSLRWPRLGGTAAHWQGICLAYMSPSGDVKPIRTFPRSLMHVILVVSR
jgi:hypothetical protein